MCKSPSAPDIDTADGGPGQKNPIVGMLLIKNSYIKRYSYGKKKHTLWWTNIAIENGPVEIVDVPINSMVIISIAMWQFTRGYYEWCYDHHGGKSYKKIYTFLL